MATGGQLGAGGQAGAGSGTGGSVAAGSGGVGAGGSGGAPPKVSGTPLVYVGGFGNFPLRVYELNKATGALTPRGNGVDGGSSPSYLAVNPAGTHLYSINEENGQQAGVSAYQIKADGTFERLNHQQGTDKSCEGSCGFTHVAVDPSGKLVLAASYDGGSVSVFPVNADGSLAAEKSMLDFGGQSFAHAVGFDSTGKYAFVPTKGLDRVQQLKLGADGTLSANTPANVQSSANAGPRHLALHPNGKLVFVMNETSSTLTAHTITPTGTLTAGASASSIPAGFQGETYGQHVEVSPDGRFVYGSNVGHDSIAVFSVDPASGAPTLVQNQPSGGAWPRDFDVDPNGEVLVVANRDSNSLSVFKIAADGKLSALGAPTTVSAEPSAVVIRYQK
jgi:6-phosphogluconolactonase